MILPVASRNYCRLHMSNSKLTSRLLPCQKMALEKYYSQMDVLHLLEAEFHLGAVKFHQGVVSHSLIPIHKMGTIVNGHYLQL